MEIQFLTQLPLFHGTDAQQLRALLPALDARLRSYTRGEAILRAGEQTRRLGVVLAGGVTLENHDAWGNRAILGHVAPGQVFAETYACLPQQPMLVSAVAAENTQVLFLDMGRLLEGTCPHRDILIRNLLSISVGKNLALSRRSFYTSAKTIRGRLLAYLSDQALLQGRTEFSIPFDRQQLADYLAVDRSALSHELSKLHREGLLSARKNHFILHQGEL